MASENARIDDNAKKTLTAVTDDANAEIRRLRVDSVTGRLKVSAIITAGSGIQSFNGLTATTQLFALGTTGTDVNIVSGVATHTFNFPDASATARGLITTGNQTLAGIKTFSSFPITPSLAPATDYQVANKKYVDDSILVENLWDRTGTTLTPHTTGDNVNLTGTLGSIHAYTQATPYDQVVTVAKSGADFTTIQGAVDSILDATTSKRYCIKIQSGVYVENVVMKDYVDLQGSGRTNAIISATSGAALTFPATKATVMDMGITSAYGTLGADSSSIVSGCVDAQLIRCDMTTSKTGGVFTMHAINITGGSFRMSENRITFTITGAAVAALNQSAICQTGAATIVLLNNNEVIMTGNDTNSALEGFETIAGSVGSFLICNHITLITNTGTAGQAAGMYLHGTASGATVSNNRITLVAKLNNYGYYIQSNAGGAVVNSRHNEIITSGATNNYATFVNTGDTINSAFDKITAVNGNTGAGAYNIVSSLTPGNLTVSGTINGLALASQSVGFTIAGGTTSKTLTVDATDSITSLENFTQLGSGAVARTKISKLQDAVHVKDFGAVGNGSTDDTAAIQLAVDTGRSVDFGDSANTYKVTSSIILKANAVYYGSGATINGSTINNSTAIFDGYATPVSGVRVTGLQFRGSTTNLVKGIKLDGVNCQVDHCDIRNFNLSAVIWANVVTDNYFEDVATTSSAAAGGIENGIDNVFIDNNTFYMGAGNPLAHAIYLGGGACNNWTVTNNVLVAKASSTTGCLINIGTVLTTAYSKVNVSNNVIDATTIAVDESAVAIIADHLVFSGNVIKANTTWSSGLWLEAIDGAVISNNDLDGNSAVVLAGNGATYFVKNTIFSNNKFRALISVRGFTASAIDTLTFFGNTFHNGISTYDFGDTHFGKLQHILMENNYFAAPVSVSNAIYFKDPDALSNDITIKANTFYHIPGNAIYVKGPTYVHTYDNNIISQSSDANSRGINYNDAVSHLGSISSGNKVSGTNLEDYIFGDAGFLPQPTHYDNLGKDGIIPVFQKSGAYNATLTVTNTTTVTLPTTGTLVSSVATANGVSASNSAGALTFSLGAIVPTSIVTGGGTAFAYSPPLGTIGIRISSLVSPTTNTGSTIALAGRYDTANNNNTTYASIAGLKENSTDTNANGFLAFYTYLDADGAHERMRISSAGVVTIANLAGTGSRAVNADANGVLSAASDARLKTNFKDLTSEVDVIALLKDETKKAVFYNWKDEKKGTQRELGMTYQMWKDVLPEIAGLEGTGEEQHGYLDYQKLTVVLFEQNKILLRRIEELEAKMK